MCCTSACTGLNYDPTGWEDILHAQSARAPQPIWRLINPEGLLFRSTPPHLLSSGPFLYLLIPHMSMPHHFLPLDKQQSRLQSCARPWRHVCAWHPRDKRAGMWSFVLMSFWQLFYECISHACTRLLCRFHCTLCIFMWFCWAQCCFMNNYRCYMSRITSFSNEVLLLLGRSDWNHFSFSSTKWIITQFMCVNTEF